MYACISFSGMRFIEHYKISFILYFPFFRWPLVAFVIQMFHCVWIIGAAIDPTDLANILFILLKYTQSEIKASFVVGRYSNETLTQMIK